MIFDCDVTGSFDLTPLWIGLNDAASEGTFVWTMGEPFAFSNWHIGEPNNLGGNEDYVAITYHRAAIGVGEPKGDWNDLPVNGTIGNGGNSDAPYYGVVEVVPEPASAALTLLGLAGFGVPRRRR